MGTQVAVYGSLRQGFGNHVLLEDEENVFFCGEDDTAPEYTMRSLGGFPGIYEGGDTSIKIEVYTVSNKVFQRLDMLEGYPRFYDRKMIDTKYGQAWIYFLKDYGNDRPVVESGDWRDR